MPENVLHQGRGRHPGRVHPNIDLGGCTSRRGQSRRGQAAFPGSNIIQVEGNDSGDEEKLRSRSNCSDHRGEIGQYQPGPDPITSQCTHGL